MGWFSITHWIVVALVVVILFGRGRISETMGDIGTGLRGFRKGLSEDEGANASAAPEPRARLARGPAEPAAPANGGAPNP